MDLSQRLPSGMGGKMEVVLFLFCLILSGNENCKVKGLLPIPFLPLNAMPTIPLFFIQQVYSFVV